MARPATGSPKWDAKEARWVVRVTLPGVGRPPVAMPGIGPCANGTPLAHGADPECDACARARRVAKIISAEARAAGAVPEEVGEIASEWHARYLKVHGALGNETRGPGSWDRWAAPHFGTTPMARVKREQVIAMRDALRDAVLRKNVEGMGGKKRSTNGLISAKRAANLWSELVLAPFARAFTDDPREYREILVGPASANPSIGLDPPMSSAEREDDKRERQALMPRVFAQLIACEAIPVEWRRLFVAAVYLYLRPEELYGLRWSDVDWDAHEIRVRRALDVRTGKEKKPKTKAAIREVPIHPNLMPLLMAMRAAAGGTEAAHHRVVPLATKTRDVEKNATMVRRFLEVAGIDNADLLDGTDTLMPFDFRSFRTTGCTWHAMSGTDSYVLARWAGHTSPEVTWNHYAKQGPDLRRRHGEPFPSLPAALIERAEGSGGVSVFLPKPASNSVSLQCEGGDLNPYGFTR